jgi:hypothetical protein
LCNRPNSPTPQKSGTNEEIDFPMSVGSEVARSLAMSFATVADRVRADFMEMPGLELTLPQAVRLWTIGADDCRCVIDTLVDLGFLKWTTRRTVVRTGADFRGWDISETADIPVRTMKQAHNSVGRQS